MRRPGLVWFGVGAGLAALDLWADRNGTPGDTVSECTRRLFRTHTPLGRAALIASWAALSGWLVPHLTRSETP